MEFSTLQPPSANQHASPSTAQPSTQQQTPILNSRHVSSAPNLQGKNLDGRIIESVMPIEKKEDKLQLPFYGESPWLIYTHGGSKHKQFQTFRKISGSGNTTSVLKSIPQLRRKSILTSIHGWLIVRDLIQHDLFSIFNPCTLQTVILPPLPQAPNNRYITCGLKSSPDSNDCLLILCFKHARQIFSCRPSQPNCYWITTPIELQNSMAKIYSVLTVNGVMYICTFDVWPSKNLLYEVMDDSSSRSLILKPLLTRSLGFVDYLFGNLGANIYWAYFVESCNRIYLVILGPYNALCKKLDYLKVFELDFDGKFWREINSLDGRSFFLESDCGTWCWGTTNELGSEGGIQRNCIYFYHFSFFDSDKERQPLYIYNLHDCSILSFRPCPSLFNAINPTWVIPQHLRLSSSVEKLEERMKEINITYHRDLELSQLEFGQESRFSELPLHLIGLISQHMHLFEYWNFRASSALFRSICPVSQRRINMFPLLLILKVGGSCKLIDPCRHDSRSFVFPSFPDPFMIQFSKNGWVLALVGKCLQYFNFFTGMKGSYPNVPDDPDCFYYGSISFSTYPTCSECLTIVVEGSISNTDNYVLIHYLESEKGTWKFCLFEGEEDIFFKPSHCCPSFVAGAFYILDKQGYLGVFQLLNEEASWQIYAKPPTLKKFRESHLVESEGDLYSVFIEKMGKWIQVFRFDNLMKLWVEIRFLENRIFFISRTSSFSILTKDDPMMKNRIYLPRLYNKGVVFYSQDTSNYHSLASDDFIEDIYGTYEPFCSCWV